MPAGLCSFFNAPDYRYNISLRNDNVWKNIGFNIIAKWQDVNHYEGTFVAGTLPAFWTIDAQVSYRILKQKYVHVLVVLILLITMQERATEALLLVVCIM